MADDLNTAQADASGTPIVSLEAITKVYGPTRANDGIDLEIAPGEVIGLVGGNGAGKSTLMRILCGVETPDAGRIVVDGSLAPPSYGAAEAQAHGIRIVHQELSLCTNLTVAENFFIEAPGHTRATPGWRAPFRARASAALERVFPGHGIDPDALVGTLTIGERQLVEIARAIATPGVRLIILDEPTSSLSANRSAQLISFVHDRAAEALAFIFISHKLKEITEIATSVALLRNGQLVWRGHANDTSADHLIDLMGGSKQALFENPSGDAGLAEKVIEIGAPYSDTPIALARGSIIALAGLEGSGQQPFLRALYRNGQGAKRRLSAAFVAGDRQKEGVFPLWSVLSNISIGRLAGRPALAAVDRSTELEAAKTPAAQLRLDAARFDAPVLELSGGNQQKALVARALVGQAPLILLDDPTRGVDIATKQDFYQLLRRIADAGRTIIWNTTEDAELVFADRVLVFAGGRIVTDLTGADITASAVLAASFASADKAAETEMTPFARIGRLLTALLPYASLAIVLGLMFNANPNTATSFGLDLLLMPAVALSLIAVAQMFIIGGSEIDLGAGAFAALVSVLAATILFDSTIFGLIAVALAIAAYSSIGALIQIRKIPAIVVTLGASFIWLGIGFTIQPTPGGSAPAWAQALVRWKLGGLPTSILLIAGIAAVAIIINRTPLGVVLRGFGNNAHAMRLSGWSALRYAVIRYAIAGLFAATAGLVLTAINTASDINSGNSYTLLSVAAVVMGGAALLGGVISPLGAVVGAITLTLIGALLGMMNIPSVFNPATQGLLLLMILAIRSLSMRSGDETG